MSLTTLIDHTLSTITYIYTHHIGPLLPEQIDSLVTSSSRLASAFILPTLKSGDITSIAALLVILYLSLRTMDYLRRSIFGWLFFFIKMAVVLILVQAAFDVSTYGWEKTLDRAGWLGGILWGWAEQAWEGTESAAKEQGFGVGGNSGGSRGRGSSGWGNGNRWS